MSPPTEASVGLSVAGAGSPTLTTDRVGWTSNGSLMTSGAPPATDVVNCAP